MPPFPFTAGILPLGSHRVSSDGKVLTLMTTKRINLKLNLGSIRRYRLKTLADFPIELRDPGKG